MFRAVGGRTPEFTSHSSFAWKKLRFFGKAGWNDAKPLSVGTRAT